MTDSLSTHLDPGRLTPVPGEEPQVQASDEQVALLTQLMVQAVEVKASDVHLRAGSPPRLRIDGELRLVKGLTPDDRLMRRFFQRMMTREQMQQFDRAHEMDFSQSIQGICRVRVNLYMERTAFCASMRLIPDATLVSVRILNRPI